MVRRNSLDGFVVLGFLICRAIEIVYRYLDKKIEYGNIKRNSLNRLDELRFNLSKLIMFDLKSVKAKTWLNHTVLLYLDRTASVKNASSDDAPLYLAALSTVPLVRGEFC